MRIHGVHFGAAGSEVDFQWSIPERRATGSCHGRASTASEWVIPFEPGDRMVELDLPRAASPESLGMSSDDRLLGLGVISLHVHVA